MRASNDNNETQIKDNEKEDDKELRELKKKLAMMKQLPNPKSKDEMIGFLMKRLQAAEEAIGTCE